MKSISSMATMFLQLLLFIFLAVSIAGADISYYSYDDVLLVANNNSNVSLDIATYFAAQRNVTNIVYLNCSAEEEINFTQFNNTILIPIEEYLIGNGLNESINYIVTTKGVPLIFNLTVEFMGTYDFSVDSKLALFLGDYSWRMRHLTTTANPYAGKEEIFSSLNNSIYLVTRLTGYNYTDVKNLIDNGNTSNTANNGTFVLDIDPGYDTSSGGSYKYANDYMRSANTMLLSKNYSVEIDETATYLTNRNDLLGYCSWGSNDGSANGVTAIPNNTWLPGAIVETYVSTSARTFTEPATYGQSLIADLIREGVSGVKGYVTEVSQSRRAP